MSTPYDLPSSLELARVEQALLPKLAATSPFFRYFPFQGKRENVLRWTQRDNYTGLQGVRGYGGKPGRISLVGDKTYLMEPGVYGEFVQLDERELTIRRDAATLSGGPIGVADLVAEAQEILLNRRLNRQEYIISKLLTAGTFSVTDGQGVTVHTDSYTQTTFTASVPWSTHATATPLADLRAVQLLSRGQSVDFGSGATALMNRKWFNHLIANTNASDFGGKRLDFGTTVNSSTDINKILTMEGLPQVEIYDEGYYDSSNTFQLFIPDNVVVMIGRRKSGASIGSFRFTMNINSPNGAPRPYTRVIDRGTMEIPASVEVHDGYNGGVTLEFPGAIVNMAV